VGINQTLLDIQLAVKSTLKLGATGMILTHNHPSEISKSAHEITK